MKIKENVITTNGKELENELVFALLNTFEIKVKEFTKGHSIYGFQWANEEYCFTVVTNPNYYLLNSGNSLNVIRDMRQIITDLQSISENRKALRSTLIGKYYVTANGEGLIRIGDVELSNKGFEEIVAFHKKVKESC